jgi:hypothetical protein
MELWDTPKPKPGTWAYKFVAWFCNNVNFCHGWLYDSDIEKPANKVYDFFYKVWLFPFKQNDCICCNTVRGLLYGGLIGYIIGSLL